MEIEYNNSKIKIAHFDSESKNILNQKLDFIKKMEKHGVDKQLVNKYSKLWVNITFKNCFYDRSIFNFIKKIDKVILD
tara:strand:+ start:1898 stop:2131 length:234 start_codon:yes stop_codon:yes gene_type:complete